MTIEEALDNLPKFWTRGSIHWPGYDNGALTDRVRVDLYHALSSGGEPRVNAFGPDIVTALERAAALAREKLEGGIELELE